VEPYPEDVLAFGSRGFPFLVRAPLRSIHSDPSSPWVSMTDEEVEAVAAELAQAGGVSWHSGKERGPLKLVMDRYRDRARLAIATLERLPTVRHDISPGPSQVDQREPSTQANLEHVSDDVVSEGSLVLYSPPGDKRT
jgi:hypothetical protein